MPPCCTPLPFPHPEELIQLSVWQKFPMGDTVMESNLPALYQTEFQALERSVTKVELAGLFIDTANLRDGQAAERVETVVASVNLFQLLGVRLTRGRTFFSIDTLPGAPPVVIVSYGFWQRHFGGSPDTLGHTITLDGVSHSVIGILPRSFNLARPTEFDIWLPLRSGLKDRYNPILPVLLQTIGRLKAGADLAEAQAELDGIYQVYKKDAFARSNTVGRLIAKRWEDVLVTGRQSTLLLFWSVTVLVLLIACANTTNLLLARIVYRENEIRMRAALGARSERLLRQLMTESLLVSLLGGGLGFALACGLLRLPAALTLPTLSFFPAAVPLNLQVMGFTLLVALLTALLVSLFPAWLMFRRTKNLAPNTGGRVSMSKGLRRLFRALVAAEIALVLVLMIGSGLLLRTLSQLNRIDTGFRMENVLSMTVELAEHKYPDEAAQRAYFERALVALRHIPGITGLGATTGLPFGSLITTVSGLKIEGRPEASSTPIILAQVSEGYLQCLQIPLLRGRYFSPSDRRDSPDVAIVDQIFAQRFFLGENPLGRQITILTKESRTIVGVVGSVRNGSLTSSNARPQMYLPYQQKNNLTLFTMNIVVRGDGDVRRLIAPIRQTLGKLDPDQPVFDIKLLPERIKATLVRQRTHFFVIGAFAALSLALAFIGIYGVVAFSVNRRVHEIGIRVAFGASPGQIVRLLLGETLLTCACGLGAGTLLAFAATRALVSLLYGVTATDPATFTGAILFVALVVLVAGLIPAIRAARLDPAQCLRHE